MGTARTTAFASLVALLAATACLASRDGGAASRSAGLIVYWSESPWPSIWSIRPDGTNRRRILRNRQNAKRPRLSPNRRWVAFDGTPPGRPPLSDFDIQIVRPDGSGRRTLAPSAQWDHDPQWSPDARLIAFSRMPPHHSDATESVIWVVRPDGSGLRRLGRGSNARWSPDGRRLVLTVPTSGSSGNLFVIRADGSGRRRLTRTPDADFAAGWSPDGRRILFTRSPRNNVFTVFVMNADGSRVRELADGIAGAWAPDGSKILYNTSFFSPLHVMNPDGSGRRRISSVLGSDPDWR